MLGSIVAFARDTESDALREWRVVNAKLDTIHAQMREVNRRIAAIFMMGGDFEDEGVGQEIVYTIDRLMDEAFRLKRLYALYRERKVRWFERHGGGNASHSGGDLRAHHRRRTTKVGRRTGRRSRRAHADRRGPKASD